MEIENRYSNAASAVEIDFGISRKRIPCKIPANGKSKIRIKLSEAEAKNFNTINIGGRNAGLHFDKVIFSNGYMWEATTHGY